MKNQHVPALQMTIKKLNAYPDGTGIKSQGAQREWTAWKHKGKWLVQMGQTFQGDTPDTNTPRQLMGLIDEVKDIFVSSSTKEQTVKKTTKAASNPEVNQYLKEAGILPGNASLGPIGPNDQWVALKKDMVTAAIKAGIKPLVQLISAMPATSLPSDIREAWEQLQSAKQFRYPSGTINNLWKIFEKLAKKRGINPMSVTAKKKTKAGVSKHLNRIYRIQDELAAISRELRLEPKESRLFTQAGATIRKLESIVEKATEGE